MRILALDIGVVTGVAHTSFGALSTATVAPKKKWAINGKYGYEILPEYYEEARKLTAYTGEYNHPYDLCVIEGLAFVGSNVINQAALHAMFYLALEQAGIPIIHVSSSQIKKWAYGTKHDEHVDPKQQMFVEAIKEFGEGAIKNDHHATAAWMTQIGWYYLNPVTRPALQYRQEILDVMRGNKKTTKK